MTDEKPLEVGDVVELKSGSPKMTIEEIDEEEADVVWFVKTTEERSRYRLSSLQRWKARPISARVIG